jgi:hypothetical protein
MRSRAVQLIVAAVWRLWRRVHRSFPGFSQFVSSLALSFYERLGGRVTCISKLAPRNVFQDRRTVCQELQLQPN